MLEKYQKIVPIINHWLLILLAYVLVQLTWAWLTYKVNYINDSIESKQNKQIGLEIKTPKTLPIFGQIKLENPIIAKAVQQTRRVKTKLNLVLKGVWFNKNDNLKSYVIIQLSSRDKIYHINDKISSLATLVEIKTDYVTLNRSGQLEVLYLRKNSHQEYNKKQVSKTTSILKPNLNNTDKRQLNHIRKELKNNPWKLSQIMSIKPYYQRGKLKGFKIRPGKERHLFYNLGLKVDDIVYAVNGETLTFSKLNAVLNAVINNGNINIGFYRNNITYSLILNL